MDKVYECNDNNKEEEEKEEENKKVNVWAPPGKSAEKVSTQKPYGYHHQEVYQGHVHHHGVKDGRQKQKKHVHKEPKRLGLRVTTNSLASPAVAASEKSASGTTSSESECQPHLVRNPT